MENTKDCIDKIFLITKIRADSRLDTTGLHLSQLLKSCENNRIKIFESGFGVPVGYVAWASVSRETLNMVANKKVMPTYQYEWHDGKIILIYDVVFSFGWKAAARINFFTFLRSKRFFAYFKKNKLVVCINKYSRYEGQYWKHKRLGYKCLKLVK